MSYMTKKRDLQLFKFDFFCRSLKYLRGCNNAAFSSPSNEQLSKNTQQRINIIAFNSN